MKKLHIICGMCGCAEMLTYEIDPTGYCDNDGIEKPEAVIYCGNCGTLFALSEILDKKVKT